LIGYTEDSLIACDMSVRTTLKKHLHGCMVSYSIDRRPQLSLSDDYVIVSGYTVTVVVYFELDVLCLAEL